MLLTTFSAEPYPFHKRQSWSNIILVLGLLFQVQTKFFGGRWSGWTIFPGILVPWTNSFAGPKFPWQVHVNQGAVCKTWTLSAYTTVAPPPLTWQYQMSSCIVASQNSFSSAVQCHSVVILHTWRDRRNNKSPGGADLSVQCKNGVSKLLHKIRGTMLVLTVSLAWSRSESGSDHPPWYILGHTRNVSKKKDSKFSQIRSTCLSETLIYSYFFPFRPLVRNETRYIHNRLVQLQLHAENCVCKFSESACPVFV